MDDLIQRGRSQGHLSLAELRNAFDQAGLTPAEGRSILRELTDSGVRLANELAEPARAARCARRRLRRGPPRTPDEADAESAVTTPKLTWPTPMW